MADDEKTQPPTLRRRQDARQRGQIARSGEISLAVSSLACTGVLSVFGSFLVRRVALNLADQLHRLGQAPLRSISAGDVSSLAVAGEMLVASVVGPIAAAAAACVVLASVPQGGLTFSSEALQLNWGRLSPAAGFKRLAPSQSGLDTLKTLLTAAILVILGWRICRELATTAPVLVWSSPITSARHGWSFMLRLLWQTGLAVLAMGAADYGVQRWRTTSALKMTRSEVKDDTKMTQGNPEIKGRIRKVRREMMRRHLLRATARATVVITNPTHYAVALAYRREQAAAPIVVAKGRDLVAEQIRSIARAHSVPIMENPVLACSLFASAEVGDMVPAELFGAVAEALACLIRNKQSIH